ncbi:MAG TPA: MgtC/SapB family protein [bacterium]|nr:MgtC/SapB family protein [bacterium]HPJ71911.1 MgtC/SapB family protein [bacterium]HPQ66287.1 MgtC/SapB family protein [bacterium]
MYDFLLPDHWVLILRILAAAVLGGAVGFERELHGRAAGLRTHLLVSTGAAAFTILSTHVAEFGVAWGGGFSRVTDPGRIAAQIVTGIGFLGAGAIIKEGFTVRGLTTAACLWVAAAIGMASGAGFLLIAAAVTAISLGALIGLNYFEKLHHRDIYRDLTVVLPNDADVTGLINLVKRKQIRILFFDFTRDYLTHTTTAQMSLKLSHRGQAEQLSHDIIISLETSGIPLKSITWSHP